MALWPMDLALWPMIWHIADVLALWPGMCRHSGLFSVAEWDDSQSLTPDAFSGY